MGSLVAVNVDGWEPPCIGTVAQLTSDDEVLVSWLQGGYKKAWLPWMTQDEEDHRRKKQWTTSVKREAILLYDFKLTKYNRLRQNTVSHLKQQYDTLM